MCVARPGLGQTQSLGMEEGLNGGYKPSRQNRVSVYACSIEVFVYVRNAERASFFVTKGLGDEPDEIRWDFHVLRERAFVRPRATVYESGDGIADVDVLHVLAGLNYDAREVTTKDGTRLANRQIDVWFAIWEGAGHTLEVCGVL